VEWQQGNALPGRPAMQLLNKISLNYRPFEFSFGHEYRAGEYLDLTETLQLPDRHTVNFRVGYRAAKDWLLRAGVDNLFTSRQIPSMGSLEGVAGPSTLQPLVLAPVFHVELEARFLN
jgi:outer membrane receptor protein involved in Fe transport